MRLVRFLLAILVLAIAGWAVYAGITWLRFGRDADSRGSGAPGATAALDRFLPAYDVSERHETRVEAPADVALEAAREVDLQNSGLAKVIFKGRRLLMRGTGPDVAEHTTMLEQVRDLGWVLLEEEPDRRMVFGAVTRPWEADVKFEGLPPEEFAAFQDSGYVKIVWTLEAEPVDSARSVFRTRTRAAATDDESRRKFRGYWARFAPGIVLLRKEALSLVKKEAERRARVQQAPVL